MEQSNQSTEIQQLRDRLFRRFHEACQQYQLLQNDDHILIGLSGGKDSLLLTELLGRQAHIYVPRIRVTAVHIRVKERNYSSDINYLEEFCHRHDVPFIVRDTTIVPLRQGPNTEQENSREKDPCFLCSWYRRKALLDLAQELGCTRIALGHHQDDILHTLLLNLIYQGSFAAMPPRLKLDKMPLEYIRPLCLIQESDIQRYATLMDYHKQATLCPYEHASSRAEVRQLYKQLEQMNPNVRSSLWNAIHNVKLSYL